MLMSIFISYRRDGGTEVANAIYTALCEDYNIFLDTESLRSGPYEPKILEKLRGCTDVLLITNATLFDRCHEPEDWINRELGVALERKKNIIPIFVGVDRFPGNIPDTLREVRDQNGIFWNEGGEDVIRKIRSFLHSNGRLVLEAVREGDRIALSDKSKAGLRALFEKNVNHGIHPAEVDVVIPDMDSVAELLPESYVEEIGQESAMNMARQLLLGHYSWNRKPLSFAVEHMLIDEELEACALLFSHRYAAKYGGKNCFFVDDNGGEKPLWLYYLWIDIIEEMLDALRENRNKKCADFRRYKHLDAVLTYRGKQAWYFLTFVERKGKEAEDTLLDIPFPCGDYYDIPGDDLAFRVYPDFYYNIGWMQAGHTSFSYEKISQIPGAFSLTRYHFGPH